MMNENTMYIPYAKSYAWYAKSYNYAKRCRAIMLRASKARELFYDLYHGIYNYKFIRLCWNIYELYLVSSALPARGTGGKY